MFSRLWKPEKLALMDISTDSLVNCDFYGGDEQAAAKYGELQLPDNLYIIGTVNMDETTFPFSRKVLDRANTIEFSYVNLIPETLESVAALDKPIPQNLKNSFLKTEYLLLAHCADDVEIINDICFKLQEINEILKEANSHIGYRVRDEIVFYLANNRRYNLILEDEAIDNAIIQKILPRIQGSSAIVKDMLCELFRYCAGDYDGYQTETDNISSKMMNAANEPSCRYKRSAEKLAFMVRRFEEDGLSLF